MPVQTIDASDLHRRREAGESVQLIDVRTPVEYEAIHAADARLIPLDKLDPTEFASTSGTICVVCKSGSRGAKACEKLVSAGVANVFNVAGGTDAWERAGLPVVRGTGKVISLERQVRIAAGLLVLIGIALGWTLHPAFYGLSAFVGAGLTFAGITDWCGMGMILARMPWNNRPTARQA